jgi:hypothetical protein
VSPDDLNWLEFPTDYTKRGTAVYYIINPVNNSAYIVKHYSSTEKLGSGVENQFKIGRSFGKSLVEISGNPEKGFLNLNVINDNDAEINVAVNNVNDRGKLNLAVKGSMNVVATREINLASNIQFYSIVSDSQNKNTNTEIFQTINSIKANTPSFTINNGKENYVLGQKLKTMLSSFFDKMAALTVEISNASTITMMGVQPLINKLQIAAYQDQITAFKDEIDSCLSEVGFIDK